MKDYIIMSNGTLRWVYLKSPNEVNIYNESSGQDWISPQDFLQLYASKELVFVLAANRPDGTAVIEAKPLKGKFESYSKFTIGIKNGMLSYINGLSSDGTRQEMSIKNVTYPATLLPRLPSPGGIFLLQLKVLKKRVSLVYIVIQAI